MSHSTYYDLIKENPLLTLPPSLPLIKISIIMKYRHELDDIQMP